MSHLSEEQLDQIIAAERWREQEPLNDWRTIAARARSEGLIREADSSGSRGSSQPWLQAAAAILILIGGIAIGRTTIGLPSTTQSVATTSTVANPAPPATPSNAPSSRVVTPSSDASFASVDDARRLTSSTGQPASQHIAANNV